MYFAFDGSNEDALQRAIAGKAKASRNAFKGGVRQQQKELQQVLRDQRSALNEIS